MRRRFTTKNTKQVTARVFLTMCPFHERCPSARERGTWLEPDQVLAGPKCIRRTGHRLNRQAATAYVGQRVAAEEHQITVALVHPERDLSVVVRISEHHTRQTILISLEVGERMVERC